MKVEKQFVVLLWMVLSAILTSCEEIFLKEVEVSAVVENKLVVQAFINPQDSLIKVKVRYAEPAIGIVELGEEGNRIVADATVILREGNTMVTLQLEEFGNYYFVRREAFPISPEKTYTLEVSVTDFLKVEATCTVPKSKIDTGKVELIGKGGVHENGTLSWEDLSNETNYYSLFHLRIREDSLDNLNIRRNSNHIGIYADTLNDGGVILSDSFVPLDVAAFDGYKFIPFVLLANVDYHYYEFHRTLEGQTLDIEFPSGIPQSVYTNIEGGFGIFAAYNGVLINLE